MARAVEAGVSALGVRLAWYPLQRTGGKRDGVCACVADRDEHRLVTVAAAHPCAFRMEGCRVAQILTLSLRCGRRHSVGEQAKELLLPLLVCTTHLTFPHHDFDAALRLRQVERCLRALREASVALPPETPVIVAGDLNGSVADAAVAMLVQRGGLEDAFAKVHGEVAAARIVTHCSHRGDQEGVDFVLHGDVGSLRRGDGDDDAAADASPAPAPLTLIPMAAVVFPPGIAPTEELPRPKVDADAADERQRFGRGGGGGEDGDVPLELRGWCQLSDHRPVCVALRIETRQTDK